MTRLPVTSVSDDSLRRNLFVSGGMHFGILLFLIFGLPHFMKPLPTPYIPVPIEIVDISDITNTRTKEEPEPPKPPVEPPKPEPQKTVQQYTPPTPPAPPQPQAKPAEPQKTEQVEALLPKPAEKPKPPAPAAKPQADLLASVLKNVEKMKPAEKAPDTKSQVKAPAQAQPQSKAPSLSDRVTISEKDALIRQLKDCWSPPIGAPNAKDLAVDVTIVVNPDRTVQTVDVVDKGRMASDPYFRAAAEAARRAVVNPKCSPLALPEGKYEDWKNTSFTFDPRDML